VFHTYVVGVCLGCQCHPGVLGVTATDRVQKPHGMGGSAPVPQTEKLGSRACQTGRIQEIRILKRPWHGRFKKIFSLV